MQESIRILLTVLFWNFSGRNEDSVHGNGIEDEITDSEERIKISNATLPYLEQLHKLLLDPPYVNINATTYLIHTMD